MVLCTSEEYEILKSCWTSMVDSTDAGTNASHQTPSIADGPPCEPPDSRWHKIWASSCVRLHLASKQIGQLTSGRGVDTKGKLMTSMFPATQKLWSRNPLLPPSIGKKIGELDEVARRIGPDCGDHHSQNWRRKKNTATPYN